MTGTFHHNTQKGGGKGKKRKINSYEYRKNSWTKFQQFIAKEQEKQQQQQQQQQNDQKQNGHH